MRYVGPVLWNKIGVDMKNLPSLDPFKTAIEKLN